MARVLSEADIVAAHRRGRRVLEVLDGDLVTPQARETAERLAVSLHEGPLATPAPVRSSAANAAQRVLWRRSPRWQASPPALRAEARRLGKVALVGAGGVGANIAHLLCNADAAAVIALIDVVPGLAESVCRYGAIPGALLGDALGAVGPEAFCPPTDQGVFEVITS